MSRAGLKTSVSDLSSHLFNLDVVPLFGGLQCLQVVAGRVVVDQFSPPFGDFFLHVDGYNMAVILFIWLLSVFNLPVGSYCSRLTLTSGNWLT